MLWLSSGAYWLKCRVVTSSSFNYFSKENFYIFFFTMQSFHRFSLRVYFLKSKGFKLTSLHRMPFKRQSADVLTRILFFASLAGGRVKLCRMTCIHASVSRSPRGHSSVAPDKRHCCQWMSSLFCGFLPNHFIHDLFLWRTSQEFEKTDLYPLSFMSLRYAVCSIIGRCFRACQRSSCAEERRPQYKN